MECRLYINNSIGYVNPDFVKYFNVKFDIESMYAEATFTFKNFAMTSFNQIKTGMDLSVEFYEYKNDIVDVKYSVPFKILKFRKIPTESSVFKEILEVSCISSYYFEDTLKDRGIKGNVSSIVLEVLSKDLPSLYKASSISSTQDSPKVRFQIGEKTQDFMKRILKYGVIDLLPIYLYMSPDGILRLDGLAKFISTSPSCILTTSLNYAEHYKIGKSDVPIYQMESFSIKGDLSDSFSRTDVLISKDLYAVNDTYTTDSSISFYNNEGGNIQAQVLTPPRKLIMPWCKTPKDAFAIASNEAISSNFHSYYCVAVIRGIAFSTLQIGSIVQLKFPYTNEEGYSKSCGDGKYLIKTIEYIYEDLNIYTKLVLIFLE